MSDLNCHKFVFKIHKHKQRLRKLKHAYYLYEVKSTTQNKMENLLDLVVVFFTTIIFPTTLTFHLKKI